MVLFTSLGANGYGTMLTTLSVILLIVASFILAALTMSSGNWLIGISGMWAYVGSISKQLSTSKNGQLSIVAIAGIIGLTVIGIGIILSKPTELYRFGRSLNHGGPTDDLNHFRKNTQFH